MYVRVATKIGYFVEECFFTGWLEPSEVCLWSLKYFSKLKAAFCEYWKSVKISCVYKEFGIKTKKVQEQLTGEMKFYWVITWFLLLRGREIKFCWEAVESTKEFFYTGVEWANFWLAGELCLSSSPVGKTMQNFLLTT